MNAAIYRSPLFYVGDKYKLMPELLGLFPDKIHRFIEPFVGGGSVCMNVTADTYLLNDINEKVIEIHQMLCRYATDEKRFFDDIYHLIDSSGLTCSARNDIVPQELKTKYVKTYYAKFNKDSYTRLKHLYNSGKARSTLVLYVLLIYGFNRILRFNKKGEFNLPVGNVDFNIKTETALKNYFRIMRDKRISWSSQDFRVFLKNIDFQENDFIYLDPPYLITFSEYNKLWDEATETALLDIMDQLDCKFAISNVIRYKGRINENFLQWSNKYNVHKIKSNYISFHDNTIKDFEEVLVTNY